MSAAEKTREKDANESVPESDDDFKYDEVSVEEDWSLTDGEEDLETMVRAIKERAEANAAAAAAAAAPRPNAASITHQPESVDVFLRNFLIQMCMQDTLECFQTEWAEMAQKGLVDPEQVGSVPEVYAENKRLEGELKNARREMEECRLAASAAAQTLVRVQKARDVHRLQHKRVVQEKNRLIEQMRKLKVQHDEKQKAVLKQADAGAAIKKDSAPPEIQPRPPASPNTQRSHSRVHSLKTNAC